MMKNTTLKVQSIPFKWLFRATLMMFFLGTFQRAQSQDVGVTSIISPMSPVCATSNQTIVVRIKNFAADTIKYNLNNVAVTVKVSGSGTQTFHDTLSLGSLAADSTQNITVTLHCNLSTAGTYAFKAFTIVTGDVNTHNDTLAPVSITVKPLPTAVITATDSLTFCQGGSVILVSDSTSGNVWTGGSTNDSLTVSTGGKYTVTVTSDGCSKTSDTTIVKVNPYPAVPTIIAQDTTIFCLGGHTVLKSSSNTGNHWTGGSTSDSLTVTTSGLYSVMVTVAGCSTPSSDTLMVVVNPLPTVTLSAFTTTPCAAAPAFVLTGGSPAGGIYSGIGVDSVGKFHPNMAGHIQGITYTYTNSNGCSSSAIKNMTVDACAGIEENSDVHAIKVYPNPSGNGEINITIKKVNFSELLVSIVDIEGREVVKMSETNIQQQSDYNKQLSISNLAKGLYYIRLNMLGDSGQAVQIQKLVVE